MLGPRARARTVQQGCGGREPRRSAKSERAPRGDSKIHGAGEALARAEARLAPTLCATSSTGITGLTPSKLAGNVCTRSWRRTVEGQCCWKGVLTVARRHPAAREVQERARLR